jgi:hypothetical protein
MANERAGQPKYGPITEDEVNAAQKGWCDALVTIGQVYTEGGDYEAVAERLIDELFTMGNFYLTNSEGEEIMVEKTLVFRRCRDGKLRLCAHKSALPYDPAR